jgi:hypothetical protein
VLKLLILAFHFSSYRYNRIDPHAAHLLGDVLSDKSSLKNVLPITGYIESICSSQARENLPEDVDQNKQAA